ncbi:hypothetical protein GCM10010211_19690 [Streptomyces albospinus]|uniref:Uncharacterized protein n=1 Tax=Streptomyces albospinus TaxID=285515 RepID=A0ABQ2UWY0_9ACTN|nr:hypothetical protein [Streptomyces albospinus]GGU55068.1 hypothetical protein GCM10010211_19690 [Streptomyces albospinus]
MSPLDLNEQAQQLRSLARGFEELHDRVRDLSYSPGTDALHQITPLLLKAQELTATALGHLAALANSTYTGVTGSRAGLESLSATVAGASLACTDLAGAIYANPYEGTPFDGFPAGDAQSRAADHAEAIPRMNSHLKDAALQLDVGATACHYLATSISRSLRATAPPAVSTQHQAAPRLNDTQCKALKSLAQGEGRLYERALHRGVSVTRVAAKDGTRISIATFRALAKRGLVTTDTSTPLLIGQDIAVTEQGQRSLAEHRPALSTTAAVPAPRTPAAQAPRR